MAVELIKKLLSEGEGFTVEFKENVNELNRSVFETVASFSNRYGGHIILGVTDDGKILGVKRNCAAAMKKNFVNMLNNPQVFAPTLYLNFEEVEIGGELLLYVHIPVTSQLVIYSGKIYDRTEDGDIDITRSAELITNLARRKSLEFTERKVFPYATESDLRFADLMSKVRIMADTRVKDHPWTKMSDMDVMRSAGLYEEDKITGVKGFNLAGILLFGRDEVIRSCTPNYVTDAILRRDNIDRYDDRLRVQTNLIDSYSMLIDFIAKHTLDKFFLLNGRTVSIRGEIARELVSNSLSHREYGSTIPATIVIERDRIVVENWCRATRPGKLDPSAFTPVPKNPLISNFFVNIGYADQLGSGVRNLYKYTKIYCGGEPTLIEGDVFKTIVPLFAEVGASEKCRRNVGEMSEKKDGLSAVQIRILELIKADGTITAGALSEKLRVTPRSIERNIKRIKELGLLIRKGGDNGGYWEIVKDLV
jgi:ATP-dependent DNA helicase RecG